jgi:hypothetical protein
MVALLIIRENNPDGTDLALEQPKLVLNRLLESGLESSLDVFQGKQIIGNLRIEPEPLLAGSHYKKGSRYLLRTLGRALVQLMDSAKRTMALDHQLFFTSDGDLRESSLNLTLNTPSFSFTLREPPAPQQPTFELESANFRLNSASLAEAGSTGQLLDMLLGALGMSSEQVRQIKRQSAEPAPQVISEARRGRFEIFGKSYRGYILKNTLGPGRELKIYLSEAGEILKMNASFLHYEFINDSLRPDNALGGEEFPRVAAEPPPK